MKASNLSFEYVRVSGDAGEVKYAIDVVAPGYNRRVTETYAVSKRGSGMVLQGAGEPRVSLAANVTLWPDSGFQEVRLV